MSFLVIVFAIFVPAPVITIIVVAIVMTAVMIITIIAVAIIVNVMAISVAISSLNFLGKLDKMVTPTFTPQEGT